MHRTPGPFPPPSNSGTWRVDLWQCSHRLVAHQLTATSCLWKRDLKKKKKQHTVEQSIKETKLRNHQQREERRWQENAPNPLNHHQVWSCEPAWKHDTEFSNTFYSNRPKILKEWSNVQCPLLTAAISKWLYRQNHSGRSDVLENFNRSELVTMAVIGTRRPNSFSGNGAENEHLKGWSGHR